MKLFSLTMPLFVIVAGGHQTQKRDPCKEGETTVDMKMCSARKYKQADDELNKVYVDHAF